MVTHPVGIDRFVFAWGQSVDFPLPGTDRDVASSATARADAFAFLKEPDAHLEPEIFAGEGTHGADVDGVKGVVVIKALAGIGR